MNTNRTQMPGTALPFNPVHALLDNLRLILLTLFAGILLLVGVIVLGHRPYYTVSSSLLFEPHIPELVYESNERYLHSFEDWMRTQAHEIENRRVLESAIIAFEDSGYTWREPDETMKTAVDRLRARLSISQINNTQIMTIDMGSGSRDGLAELVNQVTNNYIAYKDQKRKEQDQKKLDYLRTEKSKYNVKLEEAYQELMDISRTYGTAIADEKNIYIYLDMFIDLRSRYNKILTQGIESNNKLDALRNQKKRLETMTVYDLKNTQTLLEIEQDINAKMLGLNKESELYQEYEQMLSEIDSSNVRSARKFLIAAIDEEINTQTMAYESAKASERDLKKELRKAQYELMAINTAVLKTSTQRQAIERIIQIWDRINNRIEQIEIELFNPGRVRVMSSAETPDFPDPSKLNKKLILGMIAIIGVALGMAAARELLDKRVKRVADVERVLGFPATGYLLNVEEEDIPESSLNQIFKRHPHSYMTELYNQITVKIEKEHEAFGSQVYFMASLTGQSGVSSSTENILSMLDADKTDKILVDLHKRPEHIESTEYVSDSDSFITWLAKNGSLEDGIIRNVNAHFDVLPMGSLREMDIARIRPSSVRELIRRLKKKYKYIFIDGPPVLMTSETQTVAQESDVTLLVVDSQKNTWPELTRAVNILNKIDVKVVSIILNKVSITRGGYFGKNLEAHLTMHTPAPQIPAILELQEV